ncbi:hypothetical protein AMTR_s00019p00170780 [Amborella trichopoda]|uniref:Uncharacterized protein n=1 Tax=Amborella trichopoda TaxID=13333 RepID=W1PBC8_AMBTC|nr:hypothetical protein AMTR_s00019p00170780 [Amborella trichopoda]
MSYNVGISFNVANNKYYAAAVWTITIVAPGVNLFSAYEPCLDVKMIEVGNLVINVEENGGLDRVIRLERLEGEEFY